MPITTTTYGFIPTQVAGCSLWLDGADPAGNGVIPANGDSITTWVDKSGLGNNATGGVSPTFNTSGINNKGTVSFNGTNSYLNSADLFSNRSFSIFIIIRRQASISSQTGILAGTQFNTNMNLHFVFRSSTNLALGFYANDLDYVSFTNYTGNSATEPAYLIQATYISGTRILYVNGNQVASDANTTNLSSQVGALIGQYNGTYYNGFIGEICILNGTPNTTSRQQIEAYLAQKWGLTSSLPIGHPGLTTTVYQSSYLKTAGPKRNIATMTPFYTAFSPRQIGGLALWLDAADSSTITGTSPVTQWRDKSVNNYTMTYTGSPTYRKTSALNNLGCITFNGTTSFNSGIDTMYWSGFSISQPFTVFVVCTKRLSSNTNFSFVLEPSTSSGSVILYGGLQLKMYAGSGDQYTNPILAFVANSTLIYRAVFNGASSLLAYSGNATSSLNPGTASWPGLYLGRDWGGVYDSGDYGEILFYNSALSTTQGQQVESYLAQKWGLTSSLPSGHLHLTQPAGAVTTLSLANSKMTLTKFGVAATGGTVTTANGYKIHTFTSVGSTNFVVTSGGSVQVLVVGGGGGGGGNYTGGGGGAGGAVFNSAFSITSGTYSVTVGALGAGWAGYSVASGTGSKGGDSTFSNITGYGGGGGGDPTNASYNSYMDGGCGGGAGGPNASTYVGVGSQGGNGGAGTGGTGCGGGGGMGGVGVACVSGQSGAGGPGATYTIGGQSYLICGGGGGGGYTSGGFTRGLGGSGIGGAGGTMDSLNGFPATYYGSGGGGSPGNSAPGGNGYQGIVIIAYKV